MKLSKALKEKKRLAAEIAHLKNLINRKNSYREGSNVPEKFNVKDLYSQLEQKVQDLVNLKIVINEANREIQPAIYLLSEYKTMISFLDILNTQEGVETAAYAQTEATYMVQFDEIKRDELKKEYQEKADKLQDSIDTYNYTTEVAWNEELPQDPKDQEDKA